MALSKSTWDGSWSLKPRTTRSLSSEYSGSSRLTCWASRLAALSHRKSRCRAPNSSAAWCWSARRRCFSPPMIPVSSRASNYLMAAERESDRRETQALAKRTSRFRQRPKSEVGSASWRPSIPSRHVAQLTKSFSRATRPPMFHLNSKRTGLVCGLQSAV